MTEQQASPGGISESAADLTTADEAGPGRVTVSQVLAQYDAQQRRAAAAAGAPTDRTAAPGLILAGDIGSLIHTGEDNRLLITAVGRGGGAGGRVGGGGWQSLTPALLRRAVSDAYDLAMPAAKAHVPVLFTDAATLRRTVKTAQRWAASSRTQNTGDPQDAKRIARLLTYRAGLPVSAYTPVLTEALACRYWLPAGHRVDDLSAWSTAFGHSDPPQRLATDPAGLAADWAGLIGRALDGVENRHLVTAMKAAERYGARSAQSASTHAACAAFTQAASLTDAHAGLMSVDPRLTERNSLAGVVSRINVHQIKQDRIEAYADNPGRLREGSKVYVFDGRPDASAGGRHVEVTLKAVEFHDENLMLVLSVPSARSRHSDLIQEAKRNYRPLYVATAPFLMHRPPPRNRRWTVNPQHQSSDRHVRVDIPVDIALAGAPT